MKNILSKKGLVIGILISLFGISIAPICNAYIAIDLKINTAPQGLIENSYPIIQQNNIEKGKNWTWMFYDDADFNRAYDPLKNFAEEAYSSENLDVIVLQDKEHGPAKMWYIDENHNKVLLSELGEINMGDYRTLYDFVEYSKENYPANRYIISFYNHGGGWLGACWDDTDDDWLSMDDIQKGLQDSGGVDVVLFTAPCLMGALESVYELKDCVDVYIGSEEGSGYGHWFGTIEGICNILNNTPDISNIELGEQIIQLINDNTPWPESITMSAVRTDRIVELTNSIDLTAHNLVDFYAECRDGLWSVYYDIQYFGGGIVLDIYDFAEKYSVVETNPDILQNLTKIMYCLNDCVISECHGSDYDCAYGLSIYFPAKKNNYNKLYNDPDHGLDFTKDTFWDEFLNKYMRSRSRSFHFIYDMFGLFLERFPILERLLELIRII
jgi:hypothetical protein